LYLKNSSLVCVVVSTTARIPAFFAASTPFGTSSNTMQSSGETFNSSVHFVKVSGKDQIDILFDIFFLFQFDNSSIFSLVK
jgi:hypothetical protein